MPGRDDAERSDGPAARHQHAPPGNRACAAHRMQAHGERLGEGRDLRRDVIRHRHGLRLRAYDHLAKAALHMGEAHGRTVELHVQAMVLHSAAAESAFVAGPAGIDRDPVARGDARHRRSRFYDPSRDLMAENHRLAHPHRAEAAGVEIMQVRTANAAALDLDRDVVGSKRIHRHRVDPEVVRGVDHDRARGRGKGKSGHGELQLRHRSIRGTMAQRKRPA